MMRIFLPAITVLLIAAPASPQKPAAPTQGDLDSELMKYSQTMKLSSQAKQRDTRSILESFTIYDSVFDAAPESEVPFAVDTWKKLRTGPYSLPQSQTFGPNQFLRYGLAAQHASGELTDTAYVKLSFKVLQREGAANGMMVLERDEGAVVEALPHVRSLYRKRGYTAADADAAAISAWRVLRIGPDAAAPSYKITASRLLSVGKDLGRLVISSEPAEAVVSVDGVRWSDRTTVSDFVPAGELEITLSKEGYDTLVEKFVVTKDKRNEFKRQLKARRL
jgi:hypothetical protein